MNSAKNEGSIPFTRFRPLVPRGLQRGRPRYAENTVSIFTLGKSAKNLQIAGDKPSR
jgi:hypothetical protein